MKTFKYIVVFSFFIIFYCAIWCIPKLHIKASLFKHNIANMFKKNGKTEHQLDDIVVKKIRYISPNEFEVFTYENKFLSVVLPYKTSKDSKNKVLLFLNNINNPTLVISKQIASDSVIADISGSYFGKIINLKDYLERK